MTSAEHATTGRRDRGIAEAYGLVIIAPVVIGLALLVVSLGRRVDSESQVRTAAEAAAQAGALERSQGAAEDAAKRVAYEMLDDEQTCANPDVHVATSDDGVGLSAGTIAVTVSCTVGNHGLEPVQPGDTTRTATAYATTDRFRAEGGG